MSATVTIIGRPNVGKSSLWNALSRTRRAIVANTPGVTRDYQSIRIKHLDYQFNLLDTAGIGQVHIDPLAEAMETKAHEAIENAQLILFMTDFKAGILPEDKALAQLCHQSGKAVILLVNKTEGLSKTQSLSDFYCLGFKHMLAVSALHKGGLHNLLSAICEYLPKQEIVAAAEPIKLTFSLLGRPNVGKSTLCNKLLKVNKQLVADLAGTTRDSNAIDFNYQGHKLRLIDTAGIRRKSKVSEVLEKRAIDQAEKAIVQSDLVLMLLDASQPLAQQDKILLNKIKEKTKPCLVALNFWDKIPKSQQSTTLAYFKESLQGLILYALYPISAMQNIGVAKLIPALLQAKQATAPRLCSSQLTRILEQAQYYHSPPIGNQYRIKLRFAHPVASNALAIAIQGKQTQYLPESYKKYLLHYFKKALQCEGTPLQLQFINDKNPYKRVNSPQNHSKKITKKQQLTS
jgi:GTPase